MNWVAELTMVTVGLENRGVSPAAPVRITSVSVASEKIEISLGILICILAPTGRGTGSSNVKEKLTSSLINTTGADIATLLEEIVAAVPTL